MISVNNKKNQNTKSVNADFTEGVLSNVFSDLNKKNQDNLDDLSTKVYDKDNLDGSHHQGKVNSKLTSVKKFSDKLGKDTSNVDDVFNSLTVDRRSIIARAKNSVLQFPIYMVNTVPISPAHIVAKTFERVYSTFVQMALAQYPLVDEDSINNLAFLKKFHTNLKESANSLFNEYYQPIDDFDQIMQDSISNTVVCENGAIARFNVVPSDNVQLNAENTRLINDPLTGFENFFAESDIADIRQREMKTKVEEYGLSDEDFDSVLGKGKPVEPVEPEEPNDDDRARSKPVPVDQETDDEFRKREDDWREKMVKQDADYQKNKVQYNLDKKKYDADIKVYNDKLEDLKNDIKNGEQNHFYKGKRVSYDSNKKAFIAINSIKDFQKSSAEFKAPVMLKDTDIKKINGMLPYTFDASFTIKASNGNAGNIVHYIIGIKSVLHLIQPRDLSSELQDLMTGDIKNLQKIRYKTGEISFWKDYIFRKDALKSDASKHIDGSKRWINTLKHLADWNKEHGSMLDKPASMLAGGNIPIPNGTLVLTQPDVLRMKSETGIDLEDVNMAKKLARNLFLIAVVILDISAGSMRVLFTDSDTSWDVQSLASIDAEIAKTDNSNLLKELNRIINK